MWNGAVNRESLTKDATHSPNLFFEVRPKLRDKEGAKQDILELLRDPRSGCQGQGIVYCMSQKDTEVGG